MLCYLILCIFDLTPEERSEAIPFHELTTRNPWHYLSISRFQPEQKPLGI